MPGLCNGVLISVSNGVTKDDCLDECQTEDRCLWFTYDSDGALCELFEDCPELDTLCQTCLSGQKQCSEYEGTQNSK